MDKTGPEPGWLPEPPPPSGLTRATRAHGWQRWKIACEVVYYRNCIAWRDFYRQLAATADDDVRRDFAEVADLEDEYAANALERIKQLKKGLGLPDET